VNEMDVRGSHFYLAMYWAEALAAQTDDAALQKIFQRVAESMSMKEAVINQELIAAQGKKLDIGGYYKPNEDLLNKYMRPSQTLNTIVSSIVPS
jgi:isocitrate dehydrogenase